MRSRSRFFSPCVVPIARHVETAAPTSRAIALASFNEASPNDGATVSAASTDDSTATVGSVHRTSEAAPCSGRSLGMQRAHVVFLLLAVACNRADPPRPAASALVATDAAPPGPTVTVVAAVTSLAESDFEGSFDGAKLFGTFEARDGVVSGSLFYERVGVDLPITGTFTNGTLVLSELERGTAVSVVTLTRPQPGGAWVGSWKKAAHEGPAVLRVIARAAGAPVVVATRVDKTRSAGCDGEDVDGRPKRVHPPTTVRVPVVLGLADRAFEHTLNDQLKALAHGVTAKCPLGVDVTFRTPLDARGFLSVVFDTRYVSEPDVGVYAWTHTGNVSSGVVVAIDRAHVGAMEEIVDTTKLGAVLSSKLLAANASCVTGPAEHPLDLLETLVLTADGAEICYEACSNHAHAAECSKVTSAKLRPALRGDSVFAPLWSPNDGG